MKKLILIGSLLGSVCAACGSQQQTSQPTRGAIGTGQPGAQVSNSRHVASAGRALQPFDLAPASQPAARSGSLAGTPAQTSGGGGAATHHPLFSVSQPGVPASACSGGGRPGPLCPAP